MSRLPSALFLSSLVTFAAAADPPAPPPEDIVFPAAPVPPTPPAPKPVPGAVATLGADQLYVVTSKTECVVRAHPAGLVKIEKQAGPVTIRGKFVDGNGKVQTKKFAAPFVYVLEAAGTGRAEIDVIPLGLKAEADIKTATIDVDSGQGPIPPPKPVPPPDTDPLLAPAQIAYTADPSATKSADKTALTAVFRALADATAAPEVKTAQNLFDLVHGSIETRIGGRLRTTRDALGAELGKVLPVQPGAALTQQNRDDAAKQLRRFATILEGVR